MRLSDAIEQLILEQLQQDGGSTELQRSELAQRFGCVPSQVTYVLSSRFTPARGYITESRRGGGGCIRIRRIILDRNEFLRHCFDACGERIDRDTALAILGNLRDNGIITQREATFLSISLTDSALGSLPPPLRPALRADLLRQYILALL